jgi:uracil-DNA glycosylase
VSNKSKALMQLKEECIACRKCAIGGCIYDDFPGNVFSSMSIKANIFVLGQNPGAIEVKTGKPFVGPSGANFDTAINEVLGMDRSDFYISNTLRCYTPNNRPPLPYEIANCQPFLERELEIVKPILVITLGNFALKQMTGMHGIEKHNGILTRSVRYDVPVLPLYHPSPMNWNKPGRRKEFKNGLKVVRAFLRTKV